MLILRCTFISQFNSNIFSPIEKNKSQRFINIVYSSGYIVHRKITVEIVWEASRIIFSLVCVSTRTHIHTQQVCSYMSNLVWTVCASERCVFDRIVLSIQRFAVMKCDYVVLPHLHVFVYVYECRVRVLDDIASGNASTECFCLETIDSVSIMVLMIDQSSFTKSFI